MDAGDLVPDEVTMAMVRDRLAEPDAAHGFLLDGFPRTVPQAEELDGMLDDLGPLGRPGPGGRRRRGRAAALRPAHLQALRDVWHVEFDPPTVEGVCDICGGELFQRDDDNPDTVRHRLEVYAEQTEPLIGFYCERGQLVAIDATGPVEDVTERALEALDPVRQLRRDRCAASRAESRSRPPTRSR